MYRVNAWQFIEQYAVPTARFTALFKNMKLEIVVSLRKAPRNVCGPVCRAVYDDVKCDVVVRKRQALQTGRYARLLIMRQYYDANWG